MAMISSKDAAAHLKLSVRRVQALIKTGRLPAKMIGGVYLIEEKDLAFVKNRKPGRPKGPPLPKPATKRKGRKKT